MAIRNKSKRYYSLPLIIVFLLLSWPLGAEEVKVLKGKEYFEVLHKALGEAKESIYVQMYIIIPRPGDADDPVSVLLEDLIQAKHRGVEVKVIMEDGKFERNYDAFTKLKETGVEVRLDSPLTVLHSKAIIIDGRTNILGSTNWSRTSIYYNQEISVLIESEELGEKLSQDFAKIELRKDIPVLPQKLKGVRIPVSLLTAKERLGSLFSDHSEKAFDLYLVLLKKAEEEDSYILPIDYEELGKALHYVKPKGRKLKPGYEKNFYYFNVRQPLHKLEERFKLVKHQPWTKSLEIIIPGAGGDSFILPNEYWKYGLDERLSFAAKYAYLVSLAEAESSKRNPYWFRSQKGLSQLYHISERSLVKGIGELERENISEVYRYPPEVKGKFDQRLANSYRMNPLISEEELGEKLKVLMDEYGRKVTLRAQELSAQLNEPKDLEDIEVFIELIKEYGYKKVREVNAVTASKRRELGLQDISYTIRLLGE